MSQYNSGHEIPGICGGVSLETKIHCFVYQGTDELLLISSGNTIKSLGILQNKPAISGHAQVMIDGCSKMIAGTNFSVGAWLTSDSAGRGVPISGTAQIVRAQAMEAASAANDVVEVLLIGPMDSGAQTS